MMKRHLNLLLAASENVAHNWAGYAVACTGLVLGLAFLLAGAAIDAGLQGEALAAIGAGADVYCTWDVFGRDMPLPRQRAGPLRSVAGVTRSVPRIVGRVRVGDEWAVVIGLPAEELARAAPELPGAASLAEGRILVGPSIARAAGLSAGQKIVLESDGAVVFTVAGVMPPASYWSARAILCELEEAARLFGELGCYTDVCLHTRPGQAELVAERVRRIHSRYRVQTRSLVRHYILEGLTLRAGIFLVLGAWALALALPLFALTSFQGLVVRRREIGLLKAEGWTTSEVLEMVALENLLVSLCSAGVALLGALVWVDLLGAPLIGAYFLPDWPPGGERGVPARFFPGAPVLAMLFSLAVTMPGGLLATWRTAVIPPTEAIR